MKTLTFHVDGVPTPQGSMKGFLHPRTGRVVVTHDNKAPLRSWRQDIAARAKDAGAEPIDGAVSMSLIFRFPRPASVPAKKRPLPSVKPDGDKLLRAVLDALTGIAFKDDAQVVHFDVTKLYADGPGLTCTVEPAVVVERPGEQLPLEVSA